MRMWMVPTKYMCTKHLLGEHVELHMFVGTINQHKRLDGYVEHNCLELKSINRRHNDIVKEMKLRGFDHKSILPTFNTSYLENNIIESAIDREKSLNELMERCDRCRQRI